MGAGCGPFCRNRALTTIENIATAAIARATNSRGCSPIAAASLPALSNVTASLRDRLGTFLHLVSCGRRQATIALGHKLDRSFRVLKGQAHGCARPFARP